MGNAEKLRAVLMKQRKKQASARLRTLLKQADGEAPKPPVPPNLTGPSSAPSRGSLMRGRPAAVQPPAPPAAPRNPLLPMDGFGFSTNPKPSWMPAPINRPVSVTDGPTIGAPNTPRMSPAASRLQQAAAQPPTQADIARNAELANQREAARTDGMTQFIRQQRDRGVLTEPEYEAAIAKRPGFFRGIEQRLRALNSLWGAAYRYPWSESRDTANRLYNAANMHAYAASSGRDPAAVGLVMQRAAAGLRADDRLILQDINQQYGDPELTRRLAQEMQKRVPGGPLSEDVRRNLLETAETYDSALRDEDLRSQQHPLIKVFDTPIDPYLARMGDQGWSMLLPPGSGKLISRAFGNAAKAKGVPNALFSSPKPVAPNLLQRYAATPSNQIARAYQPFALPLEGFETAVQNNMQRIQPALNITESDLKTPEYASTPEYYGLKADELALRPQQFAEFAPLLGVNSPGMHNAKFPQSVVSKYSINLTAQPLNGPGGKPVLNPDGTPQMQLFYELNIPSADGSSPTQRISAAAIDAADLSAPLNAAASGQGALPDQKQVSNDAATTVTTSPMRAPISKSLAETGKAPQETAAIAEKNLADQGKTEDQIKSLTEWWGEPGNIATALGVSAAAVGLLMMFFGGQDGLMGWLMPALGLTMAAGGLGTLGYQGTFGKDIQNALQGAINPALPSLAASAHDTGFIPDETYNKMVLQNMSPEDLAALQRAQGTATYGNALTQRMRINEDADHNNSITRGWNALTDVAGDTVNAVAPEVSDDMIMQQLQQQDPALYARIMNELSARYRQQTLLPFLRGKGTL